MDRRSFMGTLLLGAFAGGANISLTAELPLIDSVEVLPLWPGIPPGAGGTLPALRIVERSREPAVYHDRVLSGIARPALYIFRPPAPDGSALVIAPGGGYRELSIDTAFAAARRFNAAGLTAFVLVYRLPREGWRNPPLVPLQDAERAMRLIRADAAQFGVDAARLGIVGFSAGGHLMGLLATATGAPAYVAIDAADNQSAAPAFAALIYPVVTMLPPYAHEASREMLLGERATQQARATWSCERRVTSAMPPTFLTAAADDPDVPPENTLAMFAALRRAHVPAELHMFEHGGHGFGIGQPGQPVAAWPDLLLQWGRAARLLP